MFFVGHRDIVQPDLMDGAKAVEGFFRFSHLIVRGSARGFPSEGVFSVRLRECNKIWKREIEWSRH